jgi:hypothetical protein
VQMIAKAAVTLDSCILQHVEDNDKTRRNAHHRQIEDHASTIIRLDP